MKFLSKWLGHLGISKMYDVNSKAYYERLKDEMRCDFMDGTVQSTLCYAAVFFSSSFSGPFSDAFRSHASLDVCEGEVMGT